MSRRGKRRMARRLLPWLVALALVLAFAACTAPTTPTQAPAATPQAATAASTSAAPAAGAGTNVAPSASAAAAATAAPGAGTSGTSPAASGGTPGAAAAIAGTPGTRTAAGGTPGTPTTTRTPTLTPTPAPTFTDLQARLLLAKAYLDGKDYDNAATLYAQLAEDTRGNAEALQGLKAALDGKAAIQATQMAPLPTEAVTPVAAVTGPTLASTTRSKLFDAFAFVVAALFLIALLYLLGAFLRWLLTALRELWYMRILPLFGRTIVPPGFLIGEFANPLATAGDNSAGMVPIAVTEKLTEWNQLVRDKQAPIELERERSTGPLAWLRVLWAWVLPPPRGYRVTGTLLNGPAGEHQLAVQRTNLGRSSVDRSRIFESLAEPRAEAYRTMAGEVGKWLVIPADIEADRAVAMARGASQGATGMSASAAFDRAIDTLLPVRQQVAQGQVDYADARRRMRDAEAILAQLPTDSGLRAELTRVVADLRRSVPGG